MIVNVAWDRAGWLWNPIDALAELDRDKAPTTIAETLCPYCDVAPDHDGYCRDCQEYAA